MVRIICNSCESRKQDLLMVLDATSKPAPSTSSGQALSTADWVGITALKHAYMQALAEENMSK